MNHSISPHNEQIVGVQFQRRYSQITAAFGVHLGMIDGCATKCTFTLSSQSGVLAPTIIKALQRLDLNARHGFDIMPEITSLAESHPELQLRYHTESGLSFEHSKLKDFVQTERELLLHGSARKDENRISGAVSWYGAFSPDMQKDLGDRFGNQIVMLALDGNNFGLLNDSGFRDFVDQKILFDLSTRLRQEIQTCWCALGLPATEFDFELFNKGGDEFFLILRSANDIRSIEAAVAGVRSLNEKVASDLHACCDRDTYSKLIEFAKIKQAAAGIVKEIGKDPDRRREPSSAITQLSGDCLEHDLPISKTLIILAKQRSQYSDQFKVPGTFDFGAVYSGADALTIETRLNALGLITLLALCDSQQYNAKRDSSTRSNREQAAQIYEFSKSNVGWNAQRSSDLIEISTLIAHQKLVEQELSATDASLDTQYMGLTLAKHRTLAERGSDSLIDADRACELTLGELLGPFETPLDITLIYDEPANFGAFNKALKDAARANLIVEERAYSIISAASDDRVKPILLLKHGAAGITRLLPRINLSESVITNRIRRLAQDQSGEHTRRTFADKMLRSEFELEIEMRRGLSQLKLDLGLATEGSNRAERLLVRHLEVSDSTTLGQLKALVDQSV